MKLKTVRHIQISNFKNLGIGKNKLDLILNRSLEDKYLGDFIIFVGANGVGKSNILTALERIWNNPEKNDRPYNIDDADDQETELLIIDKDGKNGIWKSNNLLKDINIDLSKFQFDQTDLNKYSKEEILSIKKILEKLIKKIKEIKTTNNINLTQYFSKTISINNENIEPLIYEEIDVQLSNGEKEKIISFVNVFLQNSEFSIKIGTDNWGRYPATIVNNKQILCSELIKELLEQTKKEIDEIVKSKITIEKSNFEELEKEKIKKLMVDNNGDNLPKIYKYVDQEFKDSDFSQDYKENLKPLLKSILNYCGINPSQFLEEGFDSNKRNLEDKARRKLSKLNKQINEILNYKDQEIEFYLRFESNKIIISFDLKNKNVVDDDSKQQYFPQLYSFQSTGQKWIINFFFNLLINTKDFAARDIILIDEIPSVLNINAYELLSDKLRKFAEQFHITILTTTQLPNLISFDFLENVRIIDKKEENIFCENNFSVLTDQNLSDTCKNLSQKMMSSTNILYQYPDAQIIFVEGITDYLYLTGIKIFLKKNNQEKYKNIFFLPINGVGNDLKTMEKIFQELQKEYRRFDFQFLVDNDENGKEFYKNLNDNGNKNVFTIQKLIGGNFREIEDCIDEQDLKNFSLKEKNVNLSATFKKCIINGDASPKTIENLQKIIDRLIDENK